MGGFSGCSKIDKYFKNDLSEEVKKAEIKMVAVLVEHNIPFRVMDHLSDTITKIFHDSEIAKNFACKRTKSAAIAYNVLGSRFEKLLIEDIKSSDCTYSVIIDESTDISTIKVLAIAVKYFSEKELKVKTRFLCSIDIEAETAEHIFNALKTALDERNLCLKNLIGFAADTTNVMFGEKSGIVARIREVNPNCIFVKCVCHSVALSVSHACKILPRAIEHLVRDIYGYFAHSSRRQREFLEFQKFTDSEQHRILRHYDIRWLSLHACISRILEQWSPLQLFFNAQVLEDKRQHASCEFIFNTLNDCAIKLYFYFLDFILPIANKFNIIFQGDYPVVHRVYRDISDMFSSIVSCYMKASYIKNTSIEHIDPKCASEYLPLQSLYLGHKVTTYLNDISERFSKEFIDDFLRRCQSFMVELSVQLKTRLPLNIIFKQLAFLDPQVAVYEDFQSISPLLSKFPNLVKEDEIQIIDNEFREMKIDSEVGNFMCGGSSTSSCNDPVSTEKFWNMVGNLKNAANFPKYQHISKFAKQMLSLPLSNVKCERIFSEINRIKTKDRNRFANKNVACILHAKEGLKESGECSEFNPDPEMIQNMNKNSLYQNMNPTDE